MQSKVEYTPGAPPYHTETAEYNWICGKVTGAVAVVDARGYEICRVRAFGGAVETFEEAAKVAQIFASAPDLLAACKALVHWADDLSHADVPWPGTLNEVVEAARDAIAQTEKR